jgi:hypothetical protein
LSWASSAAFILDGAKINLPSGKSTYQLIRLKAPVMSLGSTEFTKASIENYSKRWFEYSYPLQMWQVMKAEWNIQGLYFVDGNLKEKIYGVTDHEFGHNWFPMMGSNERLFAWMDEGFNTFINSLSSVDFNNGEYKAEPVIYTKELRLYR